MSPDHSRDPWSTLLTGAVPRDHIVQLYQDQQFLNRAVCRFAAGAIAHGEGAIRFAVGERVGIAWLRGTCGTCRFCTTDRENLCLTPTFTGWDADGGYADLAVVPQDLIHARIASGLSQKELAERLGMPEQQIQRYEATDYESVSFARIMEIVEALQEVLREVSITPNRYAEGGRLR